MHQEFPKLMYGRGASTRLVHDAAEQDRATSDGFATSPGEAHRVAHRTAGPADPVGVLPLTESHIPLIVDAVTDAVFDRLKGMAVAATEGEAHRDALHDGLDTRLAALKSEILEGISALIAPAPAPAKSGKA